MKTLIWKWIVFWAIDSELDVQRQGSLALPITLIHPVAFYTDRMKCGQQVWIFLELSQQRLYV